MSGGVERGISALPEQVAALPPDERARFESIFSVTRSRGSLEPPPEMAPWLERAFGSVEAVREQRVVKVLNRLTLEGTLFNDLRARRPIESRAEGGQAAAGEGTDAFCSPLTGTPADTFGRIEGERTITASNVAKYDGLHGVVIKRAHNPLAWSRDEVLDAFDTAMRWLERAHEDQPTAVYPFVMWNCLPRSGASIVHAHMQATLGEGGAYARVEAWRRAGVAYAERTGRSYFDDFHALHTALGLGGEHGEVRWLAHLTPLKEKELVLLAPRADEALYGRIWELVRVYLDQLGVRAFNLALYLPPLAAVEEDWRGFPAVLRLVDRGDPASATSDIGAMELFAQPVVASDPWKVAGAVRLA